MARRRSQSGSWNGLNLAGVDDVLQRWQARFFDGELPPAVRQPAFAAFRARRYSNEALSWGLSAWQARTLDEFRSHVGLSEFLVEVTELGCAFDIISAAVRVVRDEARHVELCRRMVRALGGGDTIPGVPQWVRSDQRRPLLERVLWSITGSLCIGETLSVAFLVASEKRTQDPLARAVMRSLAADESFHSQLGWRLFPLFWPTLKRPMKKRVLEDLEGLLIAVAQMTSDSEDRAEAPQHRNPFGELFASERRQVFDQALEIKVLQRFEAQGVPARKVWRSIERRFDGR